MDLVVDANIFFSTLIKSGETERLFFVDNLHLYSPEFLMEEMDKYRTILLIKTHRTELEFVRFIQVLNNRIQYVPLEEIKPMMSLAREISPDPNDSAYFALALKINASIWTNDKRLKKQDQVRIYSTSELINLYPDD